jgi:hypothetical protein
MKSIADPKMSRRQAKLLWNSLTPQQKAQMNEMLAKLNRGELLLENVNVDDNEVIQNIVLATKNKPSAPTEPFAKHFHLPNMDD